MNRAERRRREKEAKKAAKQARVANSADATEQSYTLYNLALGLQRQGKTAEAITHYRRAIKLNADFAEAHANLGNLYEEQGKLQEAESAYRKALAIYPDNAMLLSNTGNVLRQQGRYEEARKILEQALGIEPDSISVLNNLGNVLLKLDETDESLRLFHRAVSQQPEHVESLVNLGAALDETGSYEEAVEVLQKALSLNPSAAVLHFNLGHALYGDKRFDEAIKAYQQAIRLNPKYLQAHFNLGSTYASAGDYEKAEAALYQALEINPKLIEVYIELANVLEHKGNREEAISVLQRALKISPGNHLLHFNQGRILQKGGQLQEAIAAYEKAIKNDAGYTKSYLHLGMVYGDLNDYGRAGELYRKTLELEPDNGVAYLNLAGVLLDQGRMDEAMEIYRQGLSVDELKGIDPHFLSSNQLFAMNYPAQFSQAQLYQEHLKFSKRYEETLTKTIKPYSNVPDRERKIRIGYVSQDFKQHSVAFFLQPLVESHNRDSIEIYCYSDVEKPDSITRLFQEYADGWRDIVGMPDDEVAALVREDSIDILVDLSGHTAAGARLLVFARKPAPIQVTYLGYPNTTGLSSMDYRLTDNWADPEGQEQYYTETLMRLPTGFLCYQPMADSPEIAPLPVSHAGHITFGSFNNLLKVVPEVLDLWSRLLLATPGSRLIMKNKSLRDSSVSNDYLAQFEKRGVQAERIELIGFLPSASDHLNLYSRIDIGLDTFPYNGTTTTCEAMWMGVPVITLCGDRHAARVGNSLLHQVGLEELIAHSEEEYLDIAKQLTSDQERLRQLRAGMRDRMQNSSLCDEQGFTRQLEDTYRKMWADWCASQKAG